MGRWSSMVFVVVLLGAVLGGATAVTASPADRAGSAAVDADVDGAVASGADSSADLDHASTAQIVAQTDADDDSGVNGTWIVLGVFVGLLAAVLLVGVRGVGLPDGVSGPFGSNDSSSTASGAGATGREPGATGAGVESAQEPDAAEPLTDEERVIALLEETDGRCKQSAIVEETQWSKSKVSMLLSRMEDEGTISKIQVGRENIIALEGSEPEAASSPFDESE